MVAYTLYKYVQFFLKKIDEKNSNDFEAKIGVDDE